MDNTRIKNLTDILVRRLELSKLELDLAKYAHELAAMQCEMLVKAIDESDTHTIDALEDANK